MTDISSIKDPLLSKNEDSSSQSEKEKLKDEKDSLRFQDVSVWTIMREARGSWIANIPGSSSWKQGRDLIEMLPMVCHFIEECYSVGPWLVAIYCLTTLWSGTKSAVSLYFSSRLLDIIQQTIMDGQVNTEALVSAVVARVAFTLADCVVDRYGQQTEMVVANRIRYLFDRRLMQANLRLDLPTFEEPETATKINRMFGRGHRGGAWEILEDLVKKIKSAASVVSQLGFLYSVLRSHPGAVWFAVLCIGKSLLEQLTYVSLWGEATYVWASNTAYRRMSSLLNIVTTKDHRIEVVSDRLMDYILREWVKARSLLGDISDEYPHAMLELSRPIILTVMDALSENLPMIFYAYQVLRSPASFSLTSVTLMQQASATLGYAVTKIVKSQRSIQQRFSEIRSLYDVDQMPMNIKDGELEYPQCGSERSSGMEVIFQNVSFAYPGAENVIKDVSFTLRRGQTVVIVGVNGSGKSTLLKLFNRLYDPNEGTILIDGEPMRSFKGADLRRSSAILFQKYSHYQLPIWENIAMGLPDEDPISLEDNEKRRTITRDDRVRKAARLGGSLEFVEGQPQGFDTVLQPYTNGWSTSSTNGSDEFQKKMKAIAKHSDVSLGQWQRLALSRLFFRAAGKAIKLVAVDEPSASLDPKMEYELFERLRELSTAQGKTMVFITHRFGYLTKRADLILVMQNGRLVEQGKHNELVKMGGEYAKLYELQAEAFLPKDVPK